jgi:hypothetical protein
MKFLTTKLIIPVWKQSIRPPITLAFIKRRLDELRRESHNIYKCVEKKASNARKNKEYKQAGHLFGVAVKMRERHAIIYYKGIMDDGHREFYNNTVKAAENCITKARNVEKHKARFNTKKKKTKNKKN